MGESDEDRTAREDLRAAFSRLDHLLAGRGYPRPTSATVQEHLGTIATDGCVNLRTLDWAAEGQALLYSPGAGVPELQAAAERVQDVTRLLEQRLPAGGIAPPPTDPGHTSSRPADSRVGSDDLWPTFDGPNPQLSRGAPGKSSPGLHWMGTLLMGGAIVVAATCIARWKPGVGLGMDPDSSQEETAAPTDPLAYYTDVLRRQPRHLKAHRWLADHYYDHRDYARAVYHHEWVIKLDPENAHSLNNLAWLLLTASRKEFRDPPRALKLAKRAVRVSRGDEAHIVDTLAVAYFQNGRRDLALRTFEEAPVAERDPEVRKLFRSRQEKFMREEPPGNWDGEE